MAPAGDLREFLLRAIESREDPSRVPGQGVAGLGQLDWARATLDQPLDNLNPVGRATGFFPGMALAIVTGHCYAAWWAQIGNADPVPETHVALLGVRDLSPTAERERVERSPSMRVAWIDGHPDRDVDTIVATLAGRVEHVYLHVDLDALDPSIAPGIVDAPVVQGLSLAQLDEVFDAITARLCLRAVALTTYAPNRDIAGGTHATALHILARIADDYVARDGDVRG